MGIGPLYSRRSGVVHSTLTGQICVTYKNSFGFFLLLTMTIIAFVVMVTVKGWILLYAENRSHSTSMFGSLEKGRKEMFYLMTHSTHFKYRVIW